MLILELDLDVQDDDIIKSALLRLSYMMPSLKLIKEKNKIKVFSENVDDKENLSEIKKNINYALYKEKIYQDNKEIRNKIYSKF